MVKNVIIGVLGLVILGFVFIILRKPPEVHILEHVETKSVESVVEQAQAVVISKAGAKMYIPASWSVVIGGDDDPFDNYVYDELERIVFYSNSPVHEKGRIIDETYERTTLRTEIGSLDLMAERFDENGIIKYVWSPDAEGSQDWFSSSFEITVPLRASGIYTQIPSETGTGVPTRYKTYAEFVNDREVVESLIKSIK